MQREKGSVRFLEAMWNYSNCDSTLHQIQLANAQTGARKMRDVKMQHRKMRHKTAGVENVRHENARNTAVWKAVNKAIRACTWATTRTVEHIPKCTTQ